MNYLLKQKSSKTCSQKKDHVKKTHLKKLSEILQIVTVETLDKFYVTSICPMKRSFRNLLEFYATILRMYMQESNENIYLKFLVWLKPYHICSNSHRKDSQLNRRSLNLWVKEEKCNSWVWLKNIKFQTMVFRAYFSRRDSNLLCLVDMRKISEILSFQDPELLLYAITRVYLKINLT